MGIRADGWKLTLPFTPNRDATLMIDGPTADWMRFEPELYNVLDDGGLTLPPPVDARSA